jgi:hypothetical protein
LDTHPELCFHLQQLIERIRQGSLERALEFAAEEEHPLLLLELERTMAIEDCQSCGSTASTRSAAENGKGAERGQSVQREAGEVISLAQHARLEPRRVAEKEE